MNAGVQILSLVGRPVFIGLSMAAVIAILLAVWQPRLIKEYMVRRDNVGTAPQTLLAHWIAAAVGISVLLTFPFLVDRHFATMGIRLPTAVRLFNYAVCIVGSLVMTTFPSLLRKELPQELTAFFDFAWPCMSSR